MTSTASPLLTSPIWGGIIPIREGKNQAGGFAGAWKMKFLMMESPFLSRKGGVVCCVPSVSVAVRVMVAGAVSGLTINNPSTSVFV